MAKTETIELTDEVELEEIEEDEDEDLAMTPKALAEELDISPKNLRNFLRKEFPRPSGEKNTSWKLTDAQIEAARVKFSETPEDDEEDADDEDEA